jgi:hypothetical protein
MRISLPSLDEMYPDDWTPWFAWRPVVVKGALVWLQTIERRFYCTYGGDGWEYRA